MKIFCPRVILLEFRRECRKRFPNEHIAVLFGQRSDAGNINITQIYPIPSAGDSNGVDIRTDTVQRAKIKALRAGEEMLGTIHSHCYRISDPTCEHPSDADISSALAFGEIIFAIVYVYANGKRTSVHWHETHPPPEVIYD